MIVYALTNKNNPTTPFYIGITNNIKQRYQQHKTKYTQHKPYIKNKEDILIKPLINTGQNQYSKIIAERIETNLIKYYHTTQHGTNKVADINEHTRKYFKEMWKQENKEQTIKKLFSKENNQKRIQTRQKKLHKKFQKIINYIHEDPCYYTTEEIIEQSEFKNINTLNTYTKKYHNQTFQKWFENYKNEWKKQHNLL